MFHGDRTFIKEEIRVSLACIWCRSEMDKVRVSADSLMNVGG
jgi:hypothetical protein